MACSLCLDERIQWVAPYSYGGEATWYLAGEGDEADSILILFCPFCGVKLDAESPEDGAIWGVQSFADWVRLERAREVHRKEYEYRIEQFQTEEWQRIWPGWTRSQP